VRAAHGGARVHRVPRLGGSGQPRGDAFRKGLLDSLCVPPARCLIDANWGQPTDVVYQFRRQSRHGAVLMPSHGRFVAASSKPLCDYRRKPGERVGTVGGYRPSGEGAPCGM